MKLCCRCKQSKSIIEFNKQSSAKDGHRSECAVCTREYDLQYRSARAERQRSINGKVYFKLYRQKRRKENINYKLKENLRNRLYKVIKGQKVGSAVEDLGCSVASFKQHIESKWQPNMSWNNYGKGDKQWSIDHIIPLSKVDLTDRAQFLKVNHYTNLQPLWHVDNIKKSNRVV